MLWYPSGKISSARPIISFRMRRSSKSKPTSPQVVAHHVDAHFLHGLLVLNMQHRLAAERLRFKGKIRILRAGIFGTAEAVLNVSSSLL